MVQSVLLGARERHALLAMVIDAGGGPKAAAAIAKRCRCSTQTLARWIAGLCGPLTADRELVRKMVEKFEASKASGAVKP